MSHRFWNALWRPESRRWIAWSLLASPLVSACADRATEPPGADRFEIVAGFTDDDTVANGELRLLTADGATQRQLVSLPGPDYDPNWSPDGRRIMFARESETPLWLIDSDGTGLRAIPIPPHFEGGARWSPDGEWITFAYYPDGRSSNIGVMRADGTGLRSVTGDQVADAVSGPAWSRDGRIAFTRNFTNGAWSIWTVNLDGSNLTRLTTGAYDVLPRWSPDGTRLLFETELNPSPGMSETRIAVVNADGSGRQVITPEVSDTQDANPSWSPDGRWILYAHWTYARGTGCSFYKIPATGGTPVPLVAGGPAAGRCMGSSWRGLPMGAQ